MIFFKQGKDSSADHEEKQRGKTLDGVDRCVDTCLSVVEVTGSSVHITCGNHMDGGLGHMY